MEGWPTDFYKPEKTKGFLAKVEKYLMKLKAESTLKNIDPDDLFITACENFLGFNGAAAFTLIPYAAIMGSVDAKKCIDECLTASEWCSLMNTKWKGGNQFAVLKQWLVRRASQLMRQLYEQKTTSMPQKPQFNVKRKR